METEQRLGERQVERQTDRQATKQTWGCHVSLEQVQPSRSASAPLRYLESFKLQVTAECRSSGKKCGVYDLLGLQGDGLSRKHLENDKTNEGKVSSPLHFVIWSLGPASRLQSLEESKRQSCVLAVIKCKIKQIQAISRNSFTVWKHVYPEN